MNAPKSPRPRRIGALCALALIAVAGCGTTGVPQTIARGGAVYQANCAACHGTNGQGQPGWRRQNSDGTYPAPPHDASGHTWHHGDGLLFRIVKEGGKVYETPGFKSSMPPFGDRLSDEEIRAVIAYIKTLWPPKLQASQGEAAKTDPFP
ncbi:MAG: cytochrome c [SAR202 cluster bacterium]|nr:cytochrome c [SAR202 cluster bacterium]